MIPRNFRKRLDIPGLAIWGVAALFVAASGAMSLAFALKLGDGGPWAVVFSLIALATQGGIALWWPTTFGRGKIGAGAVAMIALPVCFLYSWGAAYDVARSNFAGVEAARETGGTALAEARAAVDRARGDLEPVADAPPEDIARQQVPANIWARTDGCTDVTIPESQTACAPWLNAKARAKAETDLAEALERLSRIDVGAAPASDDGGPALVLASSVGALAGVTIHSFYQLMGWLMMLVTEIGAAVGPLVAALAARGQASTRVNGARIWAQTHASALADSPPPSCAVGGAHTGQGYETWQLQDARAWRAERIEDAPGAKPLKYPAMYRDYEMWAMATGREIIPRNWFGQLLTHELGMSKVKSGGVFYLNVRLRAGAAVPAQAEAA